MQFLRAKIYEHFTIEDGWIGSKHIKRHSTSRHRSTIRRAIRISDTAIRLLHAMQSQE